MVCTVTHLVDTRVGVRDELADGGPDIWLQWVNTHRRFIDLKRYWPPRASGTELQ